MQQAAENKVNLGIRATDERRRSLRRMAADKGLSVQRLVDYALDMTYFSGKATFPLRENQAPLGEMSENERRLLSNGLECLRAGGKEGRLVAAILEACGKKSK